MVGQRARNARAVCTRVAAAIGKRGDAVPSRSPLPALLPALALLLVGLAGLAWATVPPARVGGQVVVIAPPGTSQIRTLAMVAGAQGALVAPGRFANIAIATSPRADFAAALRREGVWFVFASPRLAGCLGAAKEDPAL